MKLFIYATDIEAVLKDDYAWSLSISSRDDIEAGDWQLIGDVEFDINIDRSDLTKVAIEAINENIKDVQAKTEIAINSLEIRKMDLLALTNEGAS